MPEHERTWRHPAEVAASLGDPRKKAPPMPPSAPPLRRRTTAVVAAASVAASIVLLAVALPAEFEQQDSPSADSTDTALVGAVKGSLAVPHVVVDGRVVSVVTVGEGLLVTSADEVSAGSSITIGGTTTEVAIVGDDPETGIAILSAPGWTDEDVLATIPAEVATHASMSTVHADGTMIPCHPSLEVAARSTAESTPIATEAPIDGAAVVSDAAGDPLGVAVATDAGTWMHSRTAVEKALTRAVAAG